MFIQLTDYKGVTLHISIWNIVAMRRARHEFMTAISNDLHFSEVIEVRETPEQVEVQIKQAKQAESQANEKA